MEMVSYTEYQPDPPKELVAGQFAEGLSHNHEGHEEKPLEFKPS